MTTRTLSIMVADLIGSTQKATSVDAIRGAKFLEDATNPIRTAITQYEGNVIKFTGDGFIATFESARAALKCGDTIRDHYIRQQYAPGGFVIDGVRIVIHTADVVFEDNDIVGDAIIICARLEKSVPTNQVWVTAATKEVVGISDFVFQPVGDIQLRGRPQPIHVYSLENTELSFIEYGTVLMITDLHHFKAVTERLAPLALNEWLNTWVNLHRQALKGMRGHIRSFISDMALITFANADDAVQAILNLQQLAQAANANRGDNPRYLFKAAIVTGDVIISASGVVGKVVNDAFDLLELVPRETVCLDVPTHDHLQTHHDHTEPVTLGPSQLALACYKVRLPATVTAETN